MRHFPRPIGLALLVLLSGSDHLIQSAAAADSAAYPPIKILSLNFNSEEAPNDPDNVMRDLRFNALNHWIEANSPDIVLLQEAWDYRGEPSVGISIGRALGYDVAYRVGMGFPGYFYDSDVILTKKTLGMSGERDIKLPHSAVEIGDGKTWVIEFGSVSWAIGVKLTLPNGDPLYLYTAHLIAATSNDRADGLKAVDADIRSRSEADGISWDQTNVIIAGDFNSDPTESGPGFLTSAGYEDAFEATHPGDESCSNCGDPRSPWFNPIAIGYGLVPSQTTEDTNARVDYIFTRSPKFKAISSTLIFSAPYQGVWMSDHYGMYAILGNDNSPSQPNPVHDVADPAQNSQILTITNDRFLCAEPWNSAGPHGAGCQTRLPEMTVNGPRGVTIENRSDFYFEIAFDGPGDIFTSRVGALNPGEETSYTFNTAGQFSYTIRNTAESPNPYRAELNGTAAVQNTGYY